MGPYLQSVLASKISERLRVFWPEGTVRKEGRGSAFRPDDGAVAMTDIGGSVEPLTSGPSHFLLVGTQNERRGRECEHEEKKRFVAWRAGGEEELICSLPQRASCRSPAKTPIYTQVLPIHHNLNFLRGEITQLQGGFRWSCRAQESIKVASKCHLVYNLLSNCQPSPPCHHPTPAHTHPLK